MKTNKQIQISSAELLPLFKDLFRGRDDVVAKYWTQEVKHGYAPICSNEWKEGICGKKKKEQDACKHCSVKAYVPLSDQLLERHFHGKHILGVYPLLLDNTCWFVAADFDDHAKPGEEPRNPLEDVRRYRDACDGQEIPCYVFKSKSGKGYHAYLFFMKPVLAWKARVVSFALLREAQVFRDYEDVTASSYDRLFPSQDALATENPLGNLIGYPFQGKAMRDGNTLLLDPDKDLAEPCPDQLSALKGIVRIPEETLDELIQRWDLKQDVPSGASTVPMLSQAERIEQLMECDFFRWAFDNQEKVREPLWYALLSNLITLRPGGLDLCHAFSRLHPGYSPKETEKKAMESLNGSPPQTCAHIRANGFPCKKQCPVKAPVGLFTRGHRPMLPEISPNSVAPEVRTMASLIPHAPIPPEVLFPDGYTCSPESGIRKQGMRGQETVDETVSFAPVIIIGRLENMEDGTESLELAWFKDGIWKRQIVDRKEIFSTREITALAKYGLTVTSSTAKMLLDYLAVFEHLNLRSLPRLRVTPVLGWQRGRDSFLWGYTLIRAGKAMLDTHDTQSLSNKQSDPSLVVFQGRDSGEDQIAKAYTSHGSYERWVEAVNLVFVHPRVISLVYFSLLTPFLDIFDTKNFTVDIANVTSTGKTTALRVAGSCWGNPNEYATERVVHSWDATTVWMERTASLLSGLPLILDDTKRARYKENISNMIYTVTNGQARARGSLDGTRHTGTIRTILLSSGEMSAVDYSEDGGARGRIVSLWGPVFAPGNGVGDFVTMLNAAVIDNYGHAGPKVVQYVLDHRDHWEEWKENYREKLRVFANRTPDNPIAQRVSAYFAALATAIPIIHDALPELRQDISAESIIDTIWNAALHSSEELDPAQRALEFLYSWAVTNKDKFWSNSTDADKYSPAAGWYGRWDADADIFFDTKTAMRILEEGKFDAKAIIKIWKDRDWLECDNKSMSKQVRIHGDQVRCYCLKMSSCRDVLNLTDDNRSTVVEDPWML